MGAFFLGLGLGIALSLVGFGFLAYRGWIQLTPPSSRGG